MWSLGGIDPVGAWEEDIPSARNLPNLIIWIEQEKEEQESL